MEKIMSSLGMKSSHDFSQYLFTALRIALVIVLILILLGITKKCIKSLRARLAHKTQDNPEEIKRIDTLARVMNYGASVVIWVVGAIVLLGELGISIGPIIATAGVLGMAVGFAAQSLIRDYFNGFFLLLENQVREGDIVEIAGKSGMVEEMTLRYIRLRNFDGHVNFVPNGSITTVTSLTREYAYSIINIGVAYREDLDEVIALIEDTAEKMRFDPAFEGKILDKLDLWGVDKWDDSAVIVTCRFKVQPLDQWAVRREYLKRLKRVFDDNNIEIPFPHLTVYPGESKTGNAPALRIVSGDDVSK